MKGNREMIAVTGATGNVGSELVRALATTDVPIRGLSREVQPVSDQVEWRQIEPGNETSLRAALDGVEKVALITAANEDMHAQELAVLAAAKDAGVKHIVKLSGLGAGPEAPIRLPQQHYKTEQAIVASGVAYTFVRPNLFMQTLIGAGDVIYAPAGDGAISFTDLRDVAATMAAALTEPGHEGSVYEITGPQALTYAEVAGILSATLGKTVGYVDVTPETARSSMVAAGLAPWLADAFVELYGIYRAGYGAAVLAGPIQTVTGKPARTLEEFAADHRAALGG